MILLLYVEINLCFYPQLIIQCEGYPHQGVEHHPVGLLDLAATLVGVLGQVRHEVGGVSGEILAQVVIDCFLNLKVENNLVNNRSSVLRSHD